MPKKGGKIEHLSQRDLDAMRILWCCNHVPRELFPLTDNRIRAYEKMGLIDRCRNIDNALIIRRTPKGKSYIGKLPEFVGRKAYVAHRASEHNCKLAELFTALPQEQKEHWRTEQELSDIYYEQLNELRYKDFERWRELIDKPWSPCDGGIVSDSGQVEELIEVVTQNYKGIEEKETYAQVVHAEVSYYQI